MKNITTIIVLLITTLCLSGCGPQYQTTYSYIPPHSHYGRSCVNQCLNNRSNCNSQCQTNYQSCKTNANILAMPQYLLYIKAKNDANQPAYRSISDFADYSGCSTYCGCTSTYRSCFTNCGGSVLANTQCVAFCNKVAQR